MPSEIAYQLPPLWGPQETDVSQLHGCLHSRSTGNMNCRNKPEIDAKDCGITTNKTETLTQNWKSYFNENNDYQYQKDSTKYAGDEISEKSEIWVRNL